MLTFEGQEFECSQENFIGVRLGRTLLFTLYRERNYSPANRTRTKYVMSARLARKLCLIESQGGCCLHCGSVEDLTLDHVEPRINFEVHQLPRNNLQVLCYTCNQAKGEQSVDFRKGETAELLGTRRRDIRWRIRIKVLEDGGCEVELRTNQGESLCKRRVEGLDEAVEYLKKKMEEVNGSDDTL